LLLILPAGAAAAPGDVVSCTMPLNLSNSPDFNSSDPLLVADQTGVAHLFWTERLTGPPNAQPDAPDTLMYSRWEDGRWSQPLDIFFSPTNVFNKRINAPRAVPVFRREVYQAIQEENRRAAAAAPGALPRLEGLAMRDPRAR